MTWHICTRNARLGSTKGGALGTSSYPFRAIRAHLTYERELFVFGVTDDGKIVELMYYFK